MKSRILRPLERLLRHWGTALSMKGQRRERFEDDPVGGNSGDVRVVVGRGYLHHIHPAQTTGENQATYGS